jgi:hypothetical protein
MNSHGQRCALEPYEDGREEPAGQCDGALPETAQQRRRDCATCSGHQSAGQKIERGSEDGAAEPIAPLRRASARIR